MNEITRLDTLHDDLIHDIAYDFYGKRLATCSSDQKIKVWDFDEEEGEWKLNDTWKAHDASILKLAWSHPEHGQVLASCSFDRSVRIWEESPTDPLQSGRHWTSVSRLLDAHEAVTDLAFAPPHMGCRLATCSSDGFMRVYEAMDVTNLGYWTLLEDFDIPNQGGFGPNMASTTPGGSGPAVTGQTQHRDSEDNYCLSWCQSKVGPAMMVIGCGRERTARIIRRDDSHNRWYSFEKLPGHNDMVHDVCWAPSIGRSYHLIATACKDGHVRIFKLSPDSAQATSDPILSGSSRTPPMITGALRKYKVENVGDFTDHGTEVWRVEWNVTGTVLSSSGDDGRVFLWKCGITGDWKCGGVVSAEQGRGADMER